MANIKSSLKRIKVNQVKALRNKMVKTNMRTALKKFEALIANGNIEEAKVLYPKTAHVIDKAASKGIIHKNAASRYKSRLAVKLNKLAVVEK